MIEIQALQQKYEPIFSEPYFLYDFERWLQSRNKKVKTMVTLQQILTPGSEYFGIKENILTGRWRNRDITGPRMMIILFMVYEGFKVSPIGLLFNRDHSSVSHSTKTMKDLIETEPHTKEIYDNMEIFIRHRI